MDRKYALVCTLALFLLIFSVNTFSSSEENFPADMTTDCLNSQALTFGQWSSGVLLPGPDQIGWRKFTVGSTTTVDMTISRPGNGNTWMLYVYSGCGDWPNDYVADTYSTSTLYLTVTVGPGTYYMAFWDNVYDGGGYSVKVEEACDYTPVCSDTTDWTCGGEPQKRYYYVRETACMGGCTAWDYQSYDTCQANYICYDPDGQGGTHATCVLNCDYDPPCSDTDDIRCEADPALLYYYSRSTACDGGCTSWQFDTTTSCSQNYHCEDSDGAGGTHASCVPDSLPDLTIIDIHTNPATPVCGDPTTVYWTFKNIGTAATPDVYSNSRIFVDGVEKNSWLVDKNFPAGAQQENTLQNYIFTSTHTLKADVDVDAQVIPESDETNNEMTISVTCDTPPQPTDPDLIIANIWTDPATSPYKVFYTVSNIGDANAGPFYVGFVVDGVPDSDRYHSSGLGMGSSVDDYLYFPAGLPVGVLTVEATADKYDDVSESDETNNQLTETVQGSDPPPQPTAYDYIDDYAPIMLIDADAWFRPTDLYFDGDYDLTNQKENYDAMKATNWPPYATYVHIEPYNSPSGYAFEYWFYYPWNDYASLLNFHDHDWEHIVVFVETLGSDPTQALYYSHNLPPAVVPWAKVRSDGLHAKVYVMNDGHASKPADIPTWEDPFPEGPSNGNFNPVTINWDNWNFVGMVSKGADTQNMHGLTYYNWTLKSGTAGNLQDTDDYFADVLPDNPSTWDTYEIPTAAWTRPEWTDPMATVGADLVATFTNKDSVYPMGFRNTIINLLSLYDGTVDWVTIRVLPEEGSNLDISLTAPDGSQIASSQYGDGGVEFSLGTQQYTGITYNPFTISVENNDNAYADYSVEIFDAVPKPKYELEPGVEFAFVETLDPNDDKHLADSSVHVDNYLENYPIYYDYLMNTKFINFQDCNLKAYYDAITLYIYFKNEWTEFTELDTDRDEFIVNTDMEIQENWYLVSPPPVSETAPPEPNVLLKQKLENYHGILLLEAYDPTPTLDRYIIATDSMAEALVTYYANNQQGEGNGGVCNFLTYPDVADPATIYLITMPEPEIEEDWLKRLVYAVQIGLISANENAKLDQPVNSFGAAAGKSVMLSFKSNSAFSMKGSISKGMNERLENLPDWMNETDPTFIYPGTPANAGEQSTLETIGNHTVARITLQAAENIPEFNITIQRKTQPSSQISGEIYQVIEIEPSISNNLIQNATLRFKVEKAWLEQKGINTDKVYIYRNTGNWEKLETILIDSNSNYYYYEVQTPGFSEFVVLGEKINEQNQPSGGGWGGSGFYTPPANNTVENVEEKVEVQMPEPEIIPETTTSKQEDTILVEDTAPTGFIVFSESSKKAIYGLLVLIIIAASFLFTKERGGTK